MFTVKVKVVPGATEEINLSEPTTVERCILLAKSVDHIDKWQVEIGGREVDLNSTVSSTCTIMLFQKANLKGNC